MTVLIALLLLASPLRAADDNTAAAAFTRFPVGARAPALGGGIAALDADPTATLSNPAGLAKMDSPFVLSLDGARQPYRQSLYFVGLGGWVRPSFCLGLSALYFSAGDDIEFRRANTVQPDSVESAFSQLYTVSLATRLFPVMDLGVSGKMMLDRIGPISATGFSADFGVNYRPYRRLALSLVSKDFGGSKLRWVTRVADRINSSLRAGATLDLNPILLVGEARDLIGAYPRYSGGVEWDLGRILVLRGGYDQGRLGGGLGARVRYGRRMAMRLDYAFGYGVLGGEEYEHRASLNLGLLLHEWRMKKLLFPTQEAGWQPRPETRPDPIFTWPGL